MLSLFNKRGTLVKLSINSVNDIDNYQNNYQLISECTIKAFTYENNLSLIKKITIGKRKRNFLKIARLINNNQYKIAIEKLEKYIEKNNFNIEMLFLLSVLKNNEDYHQKFIKELLDKQQSKKIIKKRYLLEFTIKLTEDISIKLLNNLDSYFIYASIIGLRSKYTKELELILDYLQKQKSDLFKVLIGEVYLKMGNYKDSILYYQEIEENEILKLYSDIKLGEILRLEGHLKASINILRKFKRNDHLYPDSFLLLGKYQLAKSYEKAAKTSFAIREYENLLLIDYNYLDTKKRLNKLKMS